MLGKKLQIKSLKYDWHVPVLFLVTLALLVFGYVSSTQISELRSLVADIAQERDENYDRLLALKSEIEEVKSTDQVKRNDELESRISNIETNYERAVEVYEALRDLKDRGKDTEELDRLFTEALALLANQDYSRAAESLASLSSGIARQEAEIATAFAAEQAPSSPVSNAPPSSGYSRQQVETGIGTYLVSMVAGDLSTTRVIVDTAADSDCTDNCPALSLGDYVNRNGAFAGINGTYFCPGTYPTCAGKANSFDLLVMNNRKTYFNSDNNVYSSNPGVIFGEGYVRFVGQVSEWGRDTSPNGVLSNFPMTVSGGNVVFGGDGDPKKGSKAGRSFVANKGNTAYIGVVHNATVAEAAIVLQALGMENALNLDSGGSTALWSGGYKAGPGRNIPNAILFVSK